MKVQDILRTHKLTRVKVENEALCIRLERILNIYPGADDESSTILELRKTVDHRRLQDASNKIMGLETENKELKRQIVEARRGAQTIISDGRAFRNRVQSAGVIKKAAHIAIDQRGIVSAANLAKVNAAAAPIQMAIQYQQVGAGRVHQISGDN